MRQDDKFRTNKKSLALWFLRHTNRPEFVPTNPERPDANIGA